MVSATIATAREGRAISTTGEPLTETPGAQLARGGLGRTLGLRSPFWLQFGVLLAMALVVLPVINNKTIAAARAAAEA